jgi:SnoaL-like domain
MIGAGVRGRFMYSEDIVQIINIINLYPVAVDTRRWDLLDQVFTEDARIEFGGAAKWNDLISLKRDFELIHRPFEATLHVTTNHQVVVNNDRANCLSYVHGRFIREVPEGGSLFESVGWYDDFLVRSSAGWRIKMRSCRMVWAGGNPAVLQTMPGVSGEQRLDSLSREAGAGRLAHLDAFASG